MEEHTDGLRDVRDGDSVEITTSEGRTLDATCILYETQHAAPETGEVRQTRVWLFAVGDTEVAATITDGLRSSPDDPEFPLYSELWDTMNEETMGYIEEVVVE